MLLGKKVVLISGVGPGMGIKLAVQAAHEGAAGLIVTARGAAKLDDAEAAVSGAGCSTPVLKMTCDIRDRAQCDAVVSGAVTRFGRIDALVNNGFIHGPSERPSVANMDGVREAFETNVVGTMNMTQAVIPQMVTQSAGAIVMVSTMATRKVVLPIHMAYAMSKDPLGSAVRHLAVELGRKGIRVNISMNGFMWGDVVGPYVERTARQTGRSAEDVAGEIAGRTALGRIPTDEECARAVLFLVSDYASAVTGAQLDINGGEWMP